MDVVNNDRTVDVVGYHYKPSEFESAIIYAQLTHYKEILLERKEITSYLKKELRKYISFQIVTNREKPVIDKLCMVFNDISIRKDFETASRNFNLP